MEYLYTKILSVFFILVILVYFGIKYFYPYLIYSVEKKTNSLYYNLYHNSKLLIFIIVVSSIIITVILNTESKVVNRAKNFETYSKILNLLICQADFDKMPQSTPGLITVAKDSQEKLLQLIGNDMESENSGVGMDYSNPLSPMIKTKIRKSKDLEYKKYVKPENIKSIRDDPRLQVYVKQELEYYAETVDNKRIQHALQHNQSKRSKRYVVMDEIQKNDPTLKMSDILRGFSSIYLATSGGKSTITGLAALLRSSND